MEDEYFDPDLGLTYSDNFDTDDKNEELREDIDSIFEVLEGAVDKYYDKLEAAKKKQPKAEW